jgi:hypothetical protein
MSISDKFRTLIASETKVLISDNEATGHIEFNGTAGTVVFTGGWKILGVAPVEDNIGISIPSVTTVTLGSDNVVYAVVDRASSTGVVTPTLKKAADFTELQTEIADDDDKLDYVLIGVATGGSGAKKVFRLFNGVTIQDGEKYTGMGADTYYGAASIQRSNSGHSATFGSIGTVTWDSSGGGTLTWASTLKVFVPGIPRHELPAGSHTFSGNSRFLYFVPDRTASSTVAINPASGLVESEAKDIDIEGHNGVDLVLIGRINHDASAFIFANGRVLNDGTFLYLEGPSVETLAFRDGGGTTTATMGNVTLKVTGVDGLDITTTTTDPGTHEATVSMAPLWHDRFLPFLMWSKADDERVTRVVYDTTNGASKGYLFVKTAETSGNLYFNVPGYDSTDFVIRLGGTTADPGLILTSEQVAWIVLPARDHSGSVYEFKANSSGDAQIQVGLLSAFPEDDPDAYIIAFRYPVPKIPDTCAFLGVKGIRDCTTVPLFEGDRLREIVASHASTYDVGKDLDLEFGYDASGTYTSSSDMYYLRFSGSMQSINLYRPGYDNPVTIQQGTGASKGTGASGKVIWELANAGSGIRDTAWVYVDPDLDTLAGGAVTVNALVDYEDEEQKPGDDTKVLFGVLAFGLAISESPGPLFSRFTLWDGTQLDLNGSATATVSGTPSGLLEEIHEGLEAAMDGGSYEPSSSNKFITINEATAADAAAINPINTRLTAAEADIDDIEADYVTEAELDDFGSGSAGGGAKIKTGVLNAAMGAYVPFLNFNKVEKPVSGFNPKDIYQVISGFDHIFTDNNSSNNGAGADQIYYNGGMVIFGDTFLFDHNGRFITLVDPDYWLGSEGNTNLTNDTLRANHCLELRESVWYGDYGGYKVGGVFNPGLTPATPTGSLYGHQWRRNSGAGAVDPAPSSADTPGANPYNVWWGRNYIYIRPNASFTQDNGNGKVCSVVEAKVSKWPPLYSSSGSSTGGQGTRTFDTTLHSDGFGNDAGTWLCIGSVYMFANLTEAAWLAASSFISVGGDNDGTGAHPQAGGFSVSADLLDPTNVRCQAFSKQGNQVTFESPMPIHYNTTPQVDTLYEDGVRCQHPSSGGSSLGPSYSPAVFTGGYNRDKGHFPNTGIDMAGQSSSNRYNSVADVHGANLNLEPLLPELPIGKVDFKISLAVDVITISSGDTFHGGILQVKQGFTGRVAESGGSEYEPSEWNDLDGAPANVWYIDNGQHDHGGGGDAANLQVHFHAEFSLAGLENTRSALFRTEVQQTTTTSEVGTLFESLSHSSATPLDQESLGVFITGYTENFNGYAASDRVVFNVDIDEDEFDDEDGGSDIQGKYGTWDDS